MLDILPHFQALMNFISLILITSAFFAIKRGNKVLHIQLMCAALGVSAVFLVSYLIYHANVGHVPFAGEGGVRYLYFTILFTHIGFAAACLGMIIVTVLRAYKQVFERHKSIARWTYPIWSFVCVSGIVVYLMAFHIYAAPAT